MFKKSLLIVALFVLARSNGSDLGAKFHSNLEKYKKAVEHQGLYSVDGSIAEHNVLDSLFDVIKSENKDGAKPLDYFQKDFIYPLNINALVETIRFENTFTSGLYNPAIVDDVRVCALNKLSLIKNTSLAEPQRKRIFAAVHANRDLFTSEKMSRKGNFDLRFNKNDPLNIKAWPELFVEAPAPKSRLRAFLGKYWGRLVVGITALGSIATYLFKRYKNQSLSSLK